MTLAANAIQKALYERLTDALYPVDVFDHIPQGTPFPYVVIGADTSVGWDDKTQDGQEFTCTIHAWDALKNGRKSVKLIMEDIYEALHRQEHAIPLGDATLTDLICEYEETFQESGEANTDQFYHGVMRFRALVMSGAGYELPDGSPVERDRLGTMALQDAASVAITGGTASFSGTVTGSNLSGTNTGDQSLGDLLPPQSGLAGYVLATTGLQVEWIELVSLKGDKGEDGTSVASILVNTLPPGSTATAAYDPSTGTATLGIPRGDAGSTGAAATITVGTTTTLSPGSPATVANSGSSSAAVFDFGIPRGADGTPGSKGDAGQSVTSITATTLAAGASATAAYNPSTGVASLGIPRGDAGAAGQSVTSIAVNTLSAGASATASYNATTGAATLGIPRGETGDTGNPGPNTVNGLITAGTNVTITGAGTSASPYNISASGGAPGGSNGQFQYNSGGSFAGATGVTFAASNPIVVAYNNADYTNAGGANSHILLNNPNSGGQTSVSSYINGGLVAKWRTDFQGNINWVAGPTGAHVFYTGGDFGSGTPRLKVVNNGQVSIGDNMDQSAPVTAQLDVISNNAGRVGALVRGTFGQGADLAQWQRVDGATLARVKADGSIGLPTLADSAATNGSLYFSSTLNKLAYKDGSGAVNALY